MMQNRRNRDLCATTMSISTVDATIIQCKTNQSNGRATINEPSKLQYKHPALAESRGKLNASLMDNAAAMASTDTNVLNTGNVSESRTQQNQETKINNKQPRQPTTKTPSRSTTANSSVKNVVGTRQVIATTGKQRRLLTEMFHTPSNQRTKTSSSKRTFDKQTTGLTQQMH